MASGPVVGNIAPIQIVRSFRMSPGFASTSHRSVASATHFPFLQTLAFPPASPALHSALFAHSPALATAPALPASPPPPFASFPRTAVTAAARLATSAIPTAPSAIARSPRICRACRTRVPSPPIVLLVVPIPVPVTALTLADRSIGTPIWLAPPSDL